MDSLIRSQIAGNHYTVEELLDRAYNQLNKSDSKKEKLRLVPPHVVIENASP